MDFSPRVFLFIFYCVGFVSQTNSIAQMSLNGGGGDISGSGGSLSYSIGQLEYVHTDEDLDWLNAGVQQPYHRKDKTKVDLPSDCFLYPNPGDGVFYLLSDHLDFEIYDYELYDLYGRKLKEGNDMEMKDPLDLRDLTEGSYKIIIENERNQIWICKVIVVSP